MDQEVYKCIRAKEITAGIAPGPWVIWIQYNFDQITVIQFTSLYSGLRMRILIDLATITITKQLSFAIITLVVILPNRKHNF